MDSVLFRRATWANRSIDIVRKSTEEMAFFQPVEGGIEITDAVVAAFGDAATECHEAVGFGGAVEEALVGACVLDDEFGAAVDGQDGCAAGSLQLGDAGPRITLEVVEGLDVVRADLHVGYPRPASLLK